MSLGDNIRIARENRGYTQTEFADMIGVKQPTFSQYETSAKTPNMITGAKIAKILGTTSEKLVSGDFSGKEKNDE